MEKLQGKRLIELGSGCGLAGIACMMRGALVTLTDLDVVIESMTTGNAHVTHLLITIFNVLKLKSSKILQRMYTLCKSNFSSVELHRPVVEALDWIVEYPPPEHPFDIILLTDCIFSPHLASPLVSQLVRLSDKKTDVICCHEVRDEVTKRRKRQNTVPNAYHSNLRRRTRLF